MDQVHTYFPELFWLKVPHPKIIEAMPRCTDIDDVHLEWDADQTLRDFLRNGNQILEAPLCQDISSCIKHEALLIPILQKMAEREHRDLPAIEQVRYELEELLKKNKQGMDLQFQDLSKKAWALKKLLGFLKMKARRWEVSTVTQSQLPSCKSICGKLSKIIKTRGFYYDSNFEYHCSQRNSLPTMR